MKDPNTYPPVWGGERVRQLLDDYEHQTEEEAVAEDKAVWDDPTQTIISIPNELVPAVRAFLSQHLGK